jgi:hypothetical protein
MLFKADSKVSGMVNDSKSGSHDFRLEVHASNMDLLPADAFSFVLTMKSTLE